MTPDFPKLMSKIHIGSPRLPRQFKNLLMLWLLLILMWYYMPIQISLDMTKVTLALLLLSPFAAGFVNCRWRGRRYTLGVGAWPAFWLWLGAAAAYSWLLAQLPQPEKALAALVISLLLGIAGAMSAARLSKFVKPQTPPENPA